MLSQNGLRRFGVRNLVPSAIKWKVKISHIYILKFFFTELLQLKRRKDFSQFGEQTIIENFFKGQQGTFVDIGAGRPITGSNTYFIYRQGWNGITVDPLQTNYVLHRLFRRRDKSVKAIIGSPGNKIFYQFEPYEYSTFVKDVAESVQRRYGSEVKLVKEIALESLPLSAVLQSLLPDENLDLLCIDTEGSDLEILQSNDWSRFRPKLIVVEDFNENSHSHGQLTSFLKEKQYLYLKKVGLSYFFVRQN